MKSYDEVFTPGMIAMVNRLKDFQYLFIEEIEAGEEEIDHKGEFWFGKNKWGFISSAWCLHYDGSIPSRDYDDVEKLATRFCHRFERDTGARTTYKMIVDPNREPLSEDEDEDLGINELSVIIEVSQNADFGAHPDAQEFSK